MGPWSHRTLFQLAPAHFPQPLPKPPHGGTVLCMVAARPMREATESGGCFCIPSALAARPLGNVRKARGGRGGVRERGSRDRVFIKWQSEDRSWLRNQATIF